MSVLSGTTPVGEPPTGMPHPDGVLLDVRSLLNDEERASYDSIRKHLQSDVRHQSIDYWNREDFAFDLLPGLADLGLGELELTDTTWLYRGLVYAETARADVSLSALVGIHNELIVGMINQLGSEEQRRTWLPSL